MSIVKLSPAQRVLLQRNLVGAIRTYMTEVSVLEMLEIAGPTGTRDLARYARYRIPATSFYTLQRTLTNLRMAGAVKIYAVGQGKLLWAVPGQRRPRQVRRQYGPPPPPTPRTSWWIGKDRDAFAEAARARWGA